jgi:hypothetical protein
MNTLVRKGFVALHEGGRPHHVSVQDDRQFSSGLIHCYQAIEWKEYKSYIC